jgi:hypothetical protein
MRYIVYLFVYLCGLSMLQLDTVHFLADLSVVMLSKGTKLTTLNPDMWVITGSIADQRTVCTS